jgi:SSS family solute:Na+ symporter
MVITLIGMFVIAGLAASGRRKAAKGLGEWTVGERKFSAATSWFLQAGESLTTFSFLGLSGLAFGGGSAASYAIGYLAVAWVGMYLMGPRIWRLAKDRGYVTQADFFTDRFRSPLLGKVVAVVGAVFLLPYLQLQITGLGLIVQLATGSRSGGNLSMIVATALTVAFVLWAGIKGIARVASFKDAMMVLALVVVVIAVPVSMGGVGHIFHAVQHSHPQLMGLDAPGYDRIWFVTAMLISSIGSAFATMPHLWPPMLSARSARTVRSNAIWLPLYQLALGLPIVIGFAGVIALAPGTDDHSVLLTLAAHSMPGWLVGVVAVAAAAAAMVPSASLLSGISALVSKNLLPEGKSERTRLTVNHLVVCVAAALALVLGITRPGLLANMLLLTYGGLSQLAPATLPALMKRNPLGAWPALLGIVAGVGCMVWLTFGGVDIGSWDPGLISLVPNLVVTVVAQVFWPKSAVTPKTAPEPEPELAARAG